jgi:hypothetical protein
LLMTNPTTQSYSELQGTYVTVREALDLFDNVVQRELCERDI